MENIERDIEENIHDYQDTFIELKITYEIALAVKEDRFEEYQRQSEEKWDEYKYGNVIKIKLIYRFNFKSIK